MDTGSYLSPLYDILLKNGFIQDEDDDRAHYVCADGAIHTIPKGGKATTRVLSKAELGFTVSLYS